MAARGTEAVYMDTSSSMHSLMDSSVMMTHPLGVRYTKYYHSAFIRPKTGSKIQHPVSYVHSNTVLEPLRTPEERTCYSDSRQSLSLVQSFYRLRLM